MLVTKQPLTKMFVLRLYTHSFRLDVLYLVPSESDARRCVRVSLVRVPRARAVGGGGGVPRAGGPARGAAARRRHLPRAATGADSELL